jgi:hypothetical protein
MAALRYFVFTASEDGFGQTAWEGLASLRAAGPGGRAIGAGACC